MSKCNKVKNPCKICLAPVSKKNGLQCEGACQSWVHYACLNYTPGKIRDIKAGVIKVSCPCPDCKSALPKEYRTNEPYSCNNSLCPANQPPKCESQKCPINVPPTGRQNNSTAQQPPCPLVKCGKTDCKPSSNPRLPDRAPSGGYPVPCKPPEYDAGKSPSDARLCKNTRCPSGCSSTNDIPGDFGGPNHMPHYSKVEEMCNTVGELTNQIKELMIQMKQNQNQNQYQNQNMMQNQNQNLIPNQNRDGVGCAGGGCGGAGVHGSIGGGVGGGARIHAQSIAPQGANDICPKPCFCPGNPGRRM